MNIDISIFFKYDDLDELRNTDYYSEKQDEILQDMLFNDDYENIKNNLIRSVIEILSRSYLDQSEKAEALAAYDIYAKEPKYRE